MKVKILTSCTGEKRYSPSNQLTQKDFYLLGDPIEFQKREVELEGYRTFAEDIYTGQQHMRLMRGVIDFRKRLGKEDIDLWILSAGYGLIPGERQVVPYECTFQGMRATEVDRWAEHLHVPEDSRQFFSQPADLVLVLLGDSYLRALGLDESVRFQTPTLFLTSTHSQKRVLGQGPVRILPLSNPEAKRFSVGLVGLKGELAARILRRLSQNGQDFLTQLLDPSVDVLSLLDEPKSETSRKEPSQRSIPTINKVNRQARSNPDVDRVIQIPESWWQKQHRANLRYFIPEWDDLVDPDFDFISDTHSGGMGDWSNEVYAHQLYPEPNYDGILISKVVAEKSVKKKQRINQMGVHRYLRVPRRFPIMGDCGAFGYIGEEIPPYTTSEILDYYTRLDFDYGVSIDHLIVTATEQQKHFRYDLTIHNAEEFLIEHHKRGLPWEPIGAVQGWDSRSYAEAARQNVEMGYKYIGLGGLVRTQTVEILKILEEVHQVVPDNINIHLFGLARIEALYRFQQLGVRSVDSASHLRRAWLGARDNYWTLSGETYAAIRIPEAGKSFRAKRIVSDGRADHHDVYEMQQNCLQYLRDFDKGKVSLNDTLDVVEQYDQLITPNRDSMRAHYQHTLEAKPWKDCPCEICKKDGVEVIIFRGNNRNRRRGFHNTYAFYNIFQRAIKGETFVTRRKKMTEYSLQLSLFDKG